MVVPFREPRTILVGGRRLAYEEVGPTDPAGTIVMLPGLGAKRQGWYKQLPAFGQRYRTIVLDYRDMGDSNQADGPYSISDLTDDTVDTLQGLGIARAHLVGVSMGGFIALELALRHPDLVDKLVLVGTSAGGATRYSPTRETMAMLTPRPGEEIGDSARRVCAWVAAPGFAARCPEEFDTFAAIARHRPMTEAAYFRQLAACRTHDVANRLDQIVAPTLVVHGDIDPLVPLENGRSLARHIRGAELIVYPDTGHIPEVERAEEFNRDLLAFLDR